MMIIMLINRALLLVNWSIVDIAQDRAGGRVSSVAVDNTGQNYIELGAQWIHGENNPVFQLAKQADLLSSVTSDEGQGNILYCSSKGKF